MPLHTQVIRDGEALSLPWGGFHVAAMVYAVTIDSGKGPFTDNESVAEQAKGLMAKQGVIPINRSDSFALMDYGVLAATPLNEGRYTMQHIDLKFLDMTDGEEFEIKVGDELVAYRN